MKNLGIFEARIKKEKEENEKRLKEIEKRNKIKEKNENIRKDKEKGNTKKEEEIKKKEEEKKIKLNEEKNINKKELNEKDKKENEDILRQAEKIRKFREKILEEKRKEKEKEKKLKEENDRILLEKRNQKNIEFMKKQEEKEKNKKSEEELEKKKLIEQEKINSEKKSKQFEEFRKKMEEEKKNRKTTQNSIDLSEIKNNLLSIPDIINEELPPELDLEEKTVNPVGPNTEMYKPNFLLGQKILIVMTYYSYSEPEINIYHLDDVKQAVKHFGISIVSVNNYKDAINELTKNQQGKCLYYACWLINDCTIKNNMKEFLNVLYKFWKNGGAVLLFSDNTPFIIETNQFLKMINSGFIMEGNYDGGNDIFGDNTGELNTTGVFNRNKNIYKYNNIQRQALSHNLYVIYEGITISSATKDNKRKLDVKNDDIYPFIPFARDSEGGITSLIKLANDKGEGDLILDGGFTKLFINMEENGTFRYIQNLAGFMARPEVHISNNINPKDYRPSLVEK